MKRKLTSRARTLLWAGTGALLGLLIGVGLMDLGFLVLLAIPWAALLVLFWTGVLLWGREARDTPKAIAIEEASPTVRPHALHVGLGFPDVPDGHPIVWGIDEPLPVQVRVRAEEGPAAGCAVRLTGHLRDGARFVAGEGVTGSDGAVTLAVKPTGVGELILDAEAVHAERRGAATATASLVRYDEEIERLFGEFRAYAHAELGPDSKSDTARELAEKLRAGTSTQASRALLELARVYELVVYGERQADRRLYLALVGALLTLQREE